MLWLVSIHKIRQLGTFITAIGKLLLLIIYRGGMISGECSAGHYCKSGAKDDLPTAVTNFTSCAANDECAGLCPVGNYCPFGTELPVPCPEHFYRNSTGAASANDCEACPAGYICPAGKVKKVFF